MFKKIILSSFLSFASLMMFAQSMTDSQVVNYIQKEQEKGTSQQQIVVNLMKRGVTTAQLQRIRRKYQHQQQEVTAVDNSTTKENVEEEVQVFYSDSLGYEADDTQNESRVFGRNIFNNRLLTFQPNRNMPTPQNYRLGAGDNVVIEVWGASQQTYNKTISPDGTVTIEGVGPVKLAGLSVSQANAALKSTLGKYYSASNIQLTIGETRSIQVQVLGEVRVPGTYTLSSLSSAFNALYSAGGINDVGTLRDIKVYRSGRVISTIDVYDYILTGNSSGDVRLQDNDIVVVGPYNCIVAVRGSVKRPMYYEMRKSESVGTLLKYAGGFTGDAYKKSVTLTRKSGANYSIHTIDEFQFNNFTVDDADSVFVGSTSSEFANKVEIRGAVERPGEFELGGSVSTVKELVAAAGGLKTDAFTTRVMIHRRKPDMTLEVLNMDIAAVVNGAAPDIPLQKYDVLFIPSKGDMHADEILSISGAVRFPGNYTFADNTTIEDLVLQAGGLTEGASTVKVDVNRRIINPEATEKTDQLTENFTFSLKDGFVIDGEQGFVLQPFDQVIVRNSPSFHRQENVIIDGAVNFEGTFAMSRKGYRLSDLVKDAGGLTNYAYAKGARLRRMLSEEEAITRAATIRAQHIGFIEDAIKGGNDFNKELIDSLLSLKTNYGRTYLVSIDLESALKNPGSDVDIEMREGDVLFVPQYSSTIKISGAVSYPVSVQYKKGKSLKYYIEHAGGYDDNAKKKRVYAVNMNGTVNRLKNSSSKGIEPGCEIYVPTKPMKQSKLTTAEMLSMGSTAASIASVIAVIANLLK